MDAEPATLEPGPSRPVSRGVAAARSAVPVAALWRPAAVYLTSRLAVFLAHVATMAAVPGPGLAELLTTWDGAWYLTIVRDGYSDEVPTGQSNIGFFPLYPLLSIGAKGVLGIGAVEALVLVALAAGLLATVLVWLLTRQLAGEQAADRAAALFAFAPGAYVFSVAYSEAVFLCAAVGACWLLIRRSYLWGGVLCALATATRPRGLALVAVAAATAAMAIWERREWRALLAPAIAPLGLVGFALYSWWHTGRPDSYYIAQHEGWGQSISLTAWAGDLALTLRVLFADAPADWNRIVPTIGLVLAGAAAVVLVRMRPPVELLVYTAAICAATALSSNVGIRPRFLLTAFPLVIALGVKLGQLSFMVVLAVSAAIMASLVVISSSSLVLTP